MRGSYRIFATSHFLKCLRRLDPAILRKIEAKLKSQVYPQLKREPYFGPNIKKLRDWEPAAWRYRIGLWRVFYEIDEPRKVVSLLTFDWRKDAY
ncbi:MAG: hypothetical protein CO113_04790 [Elusimicrobia bacterium CG_4_9_14_3_um_filter_62_55]|nr:MAG: hypothetical protein COR54_14550 [Elusimicrobia bacterium CG22_combo_CG10-13_8_21_14_all_63_91]PJA14624.1 MAG: hypothetical protein COX66_12010 [Elusimicrobia bacterium CG_4_10_14_0_2_um_filter_63_34]PJB26135.1 MAG: hypothetical protein CO113_04790 [Elusimicrobia bacterium CG_4_9_14_3_um_filter_62_55]